MSDVLIVEEKTETKGLFAPFWRWHFYASLIVIPIMALLAITGLIWMFRYEIQAIVHPEIVSGYSHENPQSLDSQTLAVLAQYPEATILSVTEPWKDRPTQFVVATGDQTLQVFVDPQTARVTGSIDPSTEIQDLAIRLHGELTLGKWGDAVIELAASWAIVMALTGYYLFFRGRKARSKAAKSEKKEKNLNPFTKLRLRNQHAWAGAVGGIGVLFLVLSGLPWTALWGSTFQDIATSQGQSFWGSDPGAESTLGEALEKSSGESVSAPWVLGESALPVSTAMDTNKILSLDYLKKVVSTDGLPGPYFIVFPEGETGVYSVIADQWMVAGNPAFSDVTQEAVVHIDQYSGEIIARYSYDEYSALAKVVSNAIAIHEGRRFGIVSQISTIAFCVGILFLCITAPIMWWRRRKPGQGLGAPRGSINFKAHPWVTVALVLLCVGLPLFGLSVLVLLLIDKFVIRKVPPLTKFFNVSS
jgi:uncharacterized iron-regulated membrane protein